MKIIHVTTLCLKILTITGLLLAPIFLTGCGDHQHASEHSHDEHEHAEHGHAEHEHGEHSHDAHDHAPHGLIHDASNYIKGLFTADNHGHDHANGDHHGNHSDDAADSNIAVTHFSHYTELFVEFPVLVVAQESTFIAHLTRLDNFNPVASAVVTVTLSGGGVADEIFSVDTASIAGIFRPVVVPKHAVTRQLSLRLQGEGLDVVHPLGTYTVQTSTRAAQIEMAEMAIQPPPDDAIAYLKEQQWQVDFALTQAIVAPARASIQATGLLRPRADGEVYLSARSAGHIQLSDRFPYPGMVVEVGQVLATIAPHLGSGGDLSTLKAAFDKARSEHKLAVQERQRLAKLWQAKAVAKSRLLEAQSAEVVSKAELDSAKHRYQQSIGGKQSNAGIPILAPISGVLAQVNVAPGQYVHEGDSMFHIVNVDRLWLEARIAEVDIAALQQPEGAWFSLQGFAGSFNTFDLDGSKVALGGAIDPISRTIPLIFEFANPDLRLRSGMFATVRVYTGNSETGIMVPATAIFNDGGQEVVYVQLGGESFVRRVVRLGIRDGDLVQILSGVAAGEWVVSQGAYLVRLASASKAEVGHGHAH